MKQLALGLVGAAALFTLWACGGSSKDDTCDPDASVACTGAKGCAGKKTCDDGGAYSACVCSPANDGGGGGGGSVPDPNFLPSDLDNLALWLEADHGVEPDFNDPNTVGRWHDRSKYGQVATTGGAPFVVFQDTGGNSFIGCPSGAALTIDDDPALQFGTDEFTVAMVIEDVSDAHETVFWSKDAAGMKTFDFVTGLDGKWQFDLGNVGVPVPKASHPGNHFVMFRRAPKTDLFVDGVEYEGQALGGDIDATGTPLTLCAPAAQLESQAIAAVIAVKGASTDAEITNLEGYLRRKYGL